MFVEVWVGYSTGTRLGVNRQVRKGSILNSNDRYIQEDSIDSRDFGMDHSEGA